MLEKYEIFGEASIKTTTTTEETIEKNEDRD
jgi:hypothetical protein